MKDCEENFAYIFYLEPDFSKGLAKECQSQGIDCETWTMAQAQNLQAEGLPRTALGYAVQLENNRLGEWYLNGKKSSCLASSRLADALFGSETVGGKHILYQEKSYAIEHIVPCDMPILFLGQGASVTEGSNGWLSLSMVRGINAPDFHKIENLFGGSDAGIDVNLLKWMVYLMAFFFFLGMLTLCFAHLNKNLACKILCLLLWLSFLKMEIFSGMAEFPIWHLPGKWSDLEGWGALWKIIGTQLSVIFRFRDYPILHRYYQSLAGCFFYLALCLLCLWLLLFQFLKQHCPA